MNILFISPNPFYQERGTPIAVDLFLRLLSKKGHSIDLLTFHEGAERVYDRVTIHRIKPFISIRDIRPNFSLKKVACDIFLFIKLWRLVFRKKYEVIHAVEESAFMAMLVGLFTGIPFIYDMDSVLSQQLMNTFPFLRFFSKLLWFFEALPIRSALMVIPVCKEIEEHARVLGARKIMRIEDIALSENQSEKKSTEVEEYGIKRPVLMYVGNLEYYQGVDLLIKSFAQLAKGKEASLIIIGGRDDHIKQYRELSSRLSVAEKVYFLGPKPTVELYTYLKRADILVSPRIAGNNTPLKIYSYLDSGVPVLATNIISHSQILSEEIALLCEPEEQKFSEAMKRLLEDRELRARLSENARQFIRSGHSLEGLEKKVFEAYGYIEEQTGKMK